MNAILAARNSRILAITIAMTLTTSIGFSGVGCVVCAPSAAGAEEIIFTVTHVSSEYVYVDGGADDGLNVGDILSTDPAGASDGVVVTFVAGHSAACEILTGSFVAGARLAVASAAVPDTSPARIDDPPTRAPAASPSTTTPTSASAAVNASAGGRRPSQTARVSGTAAVQWYVADDRSGRNLDLSEPTARLRLRGRHLAGGPLSFDLRLRTRREDVRSISAGDEFSEWQNRVYTMSVSYGTSDGMTDVRVGRLTAPEGGGIGAVDGVYAARRVSPRWRVAVFGGRQPDWSDAGPSARTSKLGAAVRWTRDESARALEGTAAAIGEYQSAAVSREYMYFRGVAFPGTAWRVVGHAEVDVNRGWRGDSRSMLTASRVGLSGRWQHGRDLTLAVHYDRHSLPRTLENAAIADSLFDDAARRGLRARASQRLGAWRIDAGVGRRDRDGDDQGTTSWNVGLSRRGRALTFPVLRIQRFFGALADGTRSTLSGDHRFQRGHTIGVEVGAYRYAIRGAERETTWVTLRGSAELGHRVSLRGSVELDQGDDFPGRRGLVEIRYGL